MAYSDFATAYLAWLESQLAYINDGADYVNFEVSSIDPTFEVTAFKNSTDVNQQQIFHNAADDQVALQRSLNEITKSPSDYLTDYAIYLESEQGLVQTIASIVEDTHANQPENNNTLTFMNNFAPAMMADFASYEPTRIL